MRTLACLALLVVSFAVSTPVAAQERAQRTEQSMLAPGDSVRIVVWRKPEFSGDFVVAPDGSITHPLYRGVKVAAMPFATAEANVRQFLSGFEENPQFVMEPLIRVAVVGEVPRPAVFALRPETTIGEAVARAGGTGPNGARNRIRDFVSFLDRIWRDCREGLYAVPFAAAYRIAEPLHDRNEAFKAQKGFSIRSPLTDQKV